MQNIFGKIGLIAWLVVMAVDPPLSISADSCGNMIYMSSPSYPSSNPPQPIPTPAPNATPPAQINYVRGRIYNISDFLHGLTIYANQPTDIELETQAKNETDFDTKVDFRFYSDDDKDFGFDSSHELSGSDLNITLEANSEREKHSDPIRITATKPGTLYFYSKLVSNGLTDYSHSDNHEQYFKLDIVTAPKVDLIINTARLVGSPASVLLNGTYRIEAAAANLGPDNLATDTKLFYFIKEPGATSFRYLEEDGIDANELTPNRLQWEATPTNGYIAKKVGIYEVKVVIDANSLVPETNENNNSYTFTFEVKPENIDLTVHTARLVGSPSYVNLGATYRIEAAFQNIGTVTPRAGIQSEYRIKKPGATSFTAIEQDGSDASELTPNRLQWESTPTSGYVADKAGMYEIMVVTDVNNSVTEMDESNNTKTFTFEVKAIGPDFIISSLGFKEGLAIKKDSKVHPFANVRNIGTTTPTKGIRLAYYIDGKYRDDDGVDANELTPGRDQYESVNNDDIKLGNTGTRTLTVCADYQGAVLETNESNNCTSVTFTVK
jgi:hypothetical protein